MANLTEAEQRQGLPWIVTSRVLNDFFMTFCFGQVLTLFLNAMGLTKSNIGVVNSIIAYCAILSLIAAPTVARFGLKRSYLLFFTLRKIFALSFLFIPWVLEHYGKGAAFLVMSGSTLLFSLCRSMGETAAYPWLQEAIPNNYRGKLQSLIFIAQSVTHSLAVLAAGFAIKHVAGLGGYQIIMCVGWLGGLLAVWCWYFVPGGTPRIQENAHRMHVKIIGEALRDPPFRSYMLILTVMAIGGAGTVFMILFQKDYLGLDEQQALSLQIPALLGMMVASYPWGWAADKYGSKPVMVIGLILSTIFPVIYFLMPLLPHGYVMYLAAIIVSFVGSLIAAGWSIGVDRYLYVRAVPPEKSSSYMSVYYAWSGLMGGIAPMLGGVLLDACKSIHGSVLGLPLNQYTPAFALNLVSFAAVFFIIRPMPADAATTTREFLKIMLTTNPTRILRDYLRERRAKRASAG